MKELTTFFARQAKNNFQHLHEDKKKYFILSVAWLSLNSRGPSRVNRGSRQSLPRNNRLGVELYILRNHIGSNRGQRHDHRSAVAPGLINREYLSVSSRDAVVGVACDIRRCQVFSVV